MTYFYIIKHAERERIEGNPALTQVGIQQAQLTGKYLKKFPIVAIYTSPLKRSFETAKYIAKKLKLKVQVDKRLRERSNWGDDPNQSFEDFLKEWNYANVHRDFQPKTGDSSRKAGQRLESVIQDLSTIFGNKHIVVATHGGIISDMLKGILSSRKIYQLTKDPPERLENHILECSITIIEKRQGKRFNIKRFASTKHLPFLLK